MAIGPTLRQAREAKGMTTSEVAQTTRMMVQLVEDLEKDDFHRIAAPIYGRGFIRLYAKAVGLDPAPLLQQHSSDQAAPLPSPAERLRPETAPEKSQKKPAPSSPTPPPTPPVPPSVPSTPSVADETETQPPSDFRLESDSPEEDLFSFASSPRSQRQIDTDQPTAGRRGILIQDELPETDAIESKPWLPLQWKDRLAGVVSSVLGRMADRVSSLQLADIPVRAITVLIALAAVLFFVVSGVRQCSRVDIAPTEDEGSIVLGIDMPEPYYE